MGIVDKLNNNGTVYNSGVNSNSTPSIPVGATNLSKLHFEYSINGLPNQPNKPTPSILDLNGIIPSNNYRNNTPEGATF